MHVFDGPDEIVDTRDKLLELMGEFGSPRLAVDASPMYQSELRAQWKAILCLSPKRIRDEMCQGLADGTYTQYDVANKLKIPEASVRGLQHEYYDEALSRALRGEF